MPDDVDCSDVVRTGWPSVEGDGQGGVDLGRARGGHVHRVRLLDRGLDTQCRDAQLTSLPIILLVSVGPLAGTIPTMPDSIREVLSLTPGAAMSDLVRIGWFGFDGPGAKESMLTLAETWGHAVQPLLVMAAWIGVAVVLAARSIRWEPRT